jgi:hypothetical protein
MDWIIDPVAPSKFRKEIPRIHDWSGRTFFRGEGGDDLFEARIATQRVPFRIKTQFTIRRPIWKFADCVQFF